MSWMHCVGSATTPASSTSKRFASACIVEASNKSVLYSKVPRSCFSPVTTDNSNSKRELPRSTSLKLGRGAAAQLEMLGALGAVNMT